LELTTVVTWPLLFVMNVSVFDKSSASLSWLAVGGGVLEGEWRAFPDVCRALFSLWDLLLVS
jgi:hypothetical protein